MSKENKKKLLIAFGATGGLCIIVMVLSGMLSYTREVEQQLPPWFINALKEDRQSLLLSDAFRSFAFIAVAFVVVYFGIYKKLPAAFYGFLAFAVMIDLAVVDKRYISNDNFTRKPGTNAVFVASEADAAIERDKSIYRVYNLQNSLSDAWNEAKTSYFHHSIGGYHGAKLKRYQELLDSCLYEETAEFVGDVQARNIKLQSYGILNMLNTKYVKFGEQANAVLTNEEANGNAWFVKEIIQVNSANEELEKVCDIDTKTTAVVDVSKFKVAAVTAADSAGKVTLTEYKPNYLRYESNSTTGGLAVFSEIYYPKGWRAFVDQKEVPILRANYVLRALELPPGKHSIEFRFQPEAYAVGNKVTTISSWLVLILVTACIAFSLKEEKAANV